MTRAAAALLAVVLLAGCASAKDRRRAAVNKYINSVNTVESQSILSWNRTRDAYMSLAHGSIDASRLRDLAAAPATIRSLRRRIAALTPPEDARRLHASLLRLLDLDARFAAEVTTFARYVHAVGPLEKGLGVDTRALRAELKRSHARRKEEQALTRYAAALHGLHVRLKRLVPPTALAPWHAQQVARVAALGRGARLLAAGLARKDGTDVRQGLTLLTGFAASSPVTRADRNAILGYDARLKRISAAAAAVSQDEGRLQRGLT